MSIEAETYASRNSLKPFVIIGLSFIDLACPGFHYIILRMCQRALSAGENEIVLIKLPNLISYVHIHPHTSYTTVEVRITEIGMFG